MLLHLEDIFAPFTKLAELNKATLEKVTADQKTQTEEIVALTEARLKAAASIKDVEGLQQFVAEQLELVKSSTEKAVASNQAIISDTQSYLKEVMELFTPAEVKPAAPKPRKRAAKKAPTPELEVAEVVDAS